MRTELLNAVARAVELKRGAYTWAEALSYCNVTFDLDEFEQEDLPRLARGQYRRLQEQINAD
jgi:hypothetical protein